MMKRFSNQPLPQPGSSRSYRTGIAPEAVVAGSMIEFAVGSQSVLLTRQDGQLFAFSNVCPHAASPLQEGRRRGYTVKCPNHGYTFDIRTGRAVWPPGEGCRLTRFKITTKDNEILLQLTSPD